MLVECGFVRATTSDGEEFTFTPSLGRVAGLGAPHEIVAMFAALHGPDAAKAAAYVLAGLCDQEYVGALIGEPRATSAGVVFEGGQMPPHEQIVIARHLMQHGICGRPKPGAAASGEFSEEFHAAEYIAAARAHFGMSRSDAEGLSMTELQQMLKMKFPEKPGAAAARDMPSAEEYDAVMKAFEERRRAT